MIKTTYRKRIFKLTMAAGLALSVYLIDKVVGFSQSEASLLSGWLLLSGLVVLLTLNLRKKLSFLALGRVKNWMQIHVYLGLILLAVFPLHINGLIVDGIFESVLYGCFMLVSLSGLIGIFISRAIPQRLSQRGDHVILEQIPSHRYALSNAVEEELGFIAGTKGGDVIENFHREKLKPFLEQPSGFFSHLTGPGRPYLAWRNEFQLLHRYLDDAQLERLNNIEAILLKKIDLDYHRSGRLLLKLWLFIHVPLSYTLLIAVLFHVYLIYGFSVVSL